MIDAAVDKTQYFYDTGTFSGSVRGITCNQYGATPGSGLVTEQIDPDGSAVLDGGMIFYKYDAFNRLIINARKVNCVGAACADTIVRQVARKSSAQTTRSPRTPTMPWIIALR
jgi:hypothetical protein